MGPRVSRRGERDNSMSHQATDAEATLPSDSCPFNLLSPSRVVHRPSMYHVTAGGGKEGGIESSHGRVWRVDLCGGMGGEGGEPISEPWRDGMLAGCSDGVTMAGACGGAWRSLPAVRLWVTDGVEGTVEEAAASGEVGALAPVAAPVGVAAVVVDPLSTTSSRSPSLRGSLCHSPEPVCTARAAQAVERLRLAGASHAWSGSSWPSVFIPRLLATAAGWTLFHALVTSARNRNGVK